MIPQDFVVYTVHGPREAPSTMLSTLTPVWPSSCKVSGPTWGIRPTHSNLRSKIGCPSTELICSRHGDTSIPLSLAQFQAQLTALGNLAKSKGPPSLAPALLNDHPHLVGMQRQSLTVGRNENDCWVYLRKCNLPYSPAIVLPTSR